MSYTNLDKPAAGETTKKSLADGLIDNDAHLLGLAGSSTLMAGANGSFETDTDNDGEPDAWVYAMGTNGVGVLDDTDSAHGTKSFKFTRALGVGNTGGTLESEDFFACTPNRQLTAQWQMKCSATGFTVKVELRFYTRAQAFISATTLYSETVNPTSWTHKAGSANPPSTAYYAKLRFTGGDASPNVAGDTFIDDVSVYPTLARTPQMQVFVANSTWTPDPGIFSAEIEMWGGGGGAGAGSGGNGGGGGGAGGYSRSRVAVVPGTGYAVTVGAGGTGGAGDGTAGGVSSVGALASANGGGLGTGGTGGGPGSAGGGGTASGDLVIVGGAGRAGGVYLATAGGEGGNAGSGGPGGRAGGNGSACGGGGGGGNNGSNGGNGGAGRVIIRW